MILVGNKRDIVRPSSIALYVCHLTSQLQYYDSANATIRLSGMEALARRWGLPFYKTSAVSNINVQEVFKHLAQQMWTEQPAVMDVCKECIVM